MRWFATLVVAALLGLSANADAEKLIAFPGAEGAGRYATGGRGGDVYRVTNLANSGPGTLREGIDSARGPRTIVFAIGGNIELESSLHVRRPHLTIAGHTAPGDGVTLKGGDLVIAGTHDVIVRYLRVRPGDIHTAPNKYQPDALTVVRCNDVMVDHVSASWSTDEVLSTTLCQNVTVQWSLITEALHHSNHVKGGHGYGSIISGTDITFHHNLYAHNHSRNPRPQQARFRSGPARPTSIHFANNVIYNPGPRFGYGGPDDMTIQFIANYGIAGPNTRTNKLFRGGDPATKVYQRGNMMDLSCDGVLNGTQVGWDAIDKDYVRIKRRKEIPRNSRATKTNVEDAASALHAVLSHAGASLRRDAVDRRIVADVKSFGTRGKHLDSQFEVGGWPDLPQQTGPKDSDADGMPDEYEKQQKLNPQDAADRNFDTDGNGYTNLEEYLHSLVGEPPAKTPAT